MDKIKSAKHTATPWNMVSQKGLIGRQKEGDRLIYSVETKEHVSETFQYRNDEHTDAETSIANAEFIVRACNSHEELVEACKDVQYYFRNYEEDNTTALVHLLKKIESALKKAGA